MGIRHLDGQVDLLDFLLDEVNTVPALAGFGDAEHLEVKSAKTGKKTAKPQKEQVVVPPQGKVAAKERLISEYLKKDEVIRSLVKQRQSKIRQFSVNKILDCITNTTYDYCKEQNYGIGISSNTIADKVVGNIALHLKRRFFPEVDGKEETQGFYNKSMELYETFTPELKSVVAFMPCDRDDFMDANLVAKKKSNAIIWHYTGKSEECDEILVFTPTTLRKGAIGSRYRITRSGIRHTSKRFRDGYRFLAGLLVIDYAIREYRRIENISEAERKEDVIYNRLAMLFNPCRKLFVNAKNILAAKVYDFLGYSYKLIPDEQRSYSNHLHTFGELMYGTPGIDVLTSTWGIGAVVSLFMLLVDEYRTEKSVAEFDKERADYALSFMTKHSIPKSIAIGMSQSLFNEYFGYVEFDEICELKKMEEVALEYEALANVFFTADKFNDVSLRFRRLGNHHASGLYYPAFKCICVDVNSPSSFVHEFFHMLDYSGREQENSKAYSRRFSFESLYNMYCGLIKEALGDVKLQGKYNLEYYTTPTEVFARCGEIYMAEVLKVSNALCQPVWGFAYPKTDAFISEVTSYFDEFMSEKFGFSREEYEKVSAV